MFESLSDALGPESEPIMSTSRPKMLISVKMCARDAITSVERNLAVKALTSQSCIIFGRSQVEHEATDHQACRNVCERSVESLQDALQRLSTASLDSRVTSPSP